MPILLVSMQVNEAAYDVLQTDIITTNATEFAAAVTATNDPAIAVVYNLLASPVYWVWCTALAAKDIYETTTPDGTTWDWTQFIARSQGERDGWRELFAATGMANPSLPNTRKAVGDIFSGAGGAAQRAHLLAMARRPARRIEKLLAVATTGGVGTRGSTANPDTLTFEGTLTFQDIAHALRDVAL